MNEYYLPGAMSCIAPGSFYDTYMNALWIERMFRYKESENSLSSALEIIKHKTERERALLRHFSVDSEPEPIPRDLTTESILLYEARSAHSFWTGFRRLLDRQPNFTGRVPGGEDPCNTLLDIGFHHLTTIVRELLAKHDVSPAPGILHVAHRAAAAPLAYDLVELFRADVVDAEVARYFRLKKKPVSDISDEISRFVYELNKRLDRPHYIQTFSQCHTYRYYMELQILHFIRAVHENKVFVPLSLPDRHDSRCLTHRNGVVE